MSKVINYATIQELYRLVVSGESLVVTREYGIHPKSGQPMKGMWVMRNWNTGEFIDSDCYINDLAARHNFEP